MRKSLFYLLFIPVLITYVFIWRHAGNSLARHWPGINLEFCPNEWKKLNQRCYRIFYQLDPLQYNDILLRCHTANGWPAIVSTKETNDFIGTLLEVQGPVYDPAFIGLVFDHNKKRFIWHDQSEADFTNWEIEPGDAKEKHCVIMTSGSKWRTVSCNMTDIQRYACERYTLTLEEAARENKDERQKTSKISGVGEFTEEMHHTSIVSGHRRAYKGFMTIGVPTLYRPLGPWYLQQTLESLINCSSPEEQRKITIVVLLADLDPNLRIMLNNKIYSHFKEHFESGLIHTIETPWWYYPSFEQLKTTYSHSERKVVWRSKQNFDFAFLMEYSYSLSDYFLQLEDDVFTVPGFIAIIKNFKTETDIAYTYRDDLKDSSGWSCLEFSELGFIAKFFHSHDILKLASLLKLFYNEQPCDVIYLHFNELMLQFQRFLRKPTIFQHTGFVSSLMSKKQPLYDLYFDPHAKVGEKPSHKPSEVPVEKRQHDEHNQGPEYPIWEERILLLKEMYCN